MAGALIAGRFRQSRLPVALPIAEDPSALAPTRPCLGLPAPAWLGPNREPWPRAPPDAGRLGHGSARRLRIASGARPLITTR